MKSDFPKTMRHPAHSHAVIGPKVVDWRGRVSYGQSVPQQRELDDLKRRVH